MLFIDIKSIYKTYERVYIAPICNTYPYILKYVHCYYIYERHIKPYFILNQFYLKLGRLFVWFENIYLLQSNDRCVFAFGYNLLIKLEHKLFTNLIQNYS